MMIQQGQVFKLKTNGPDGKPLWAYRYRLEGRESERPQIGGFATRGEAEKALRKVLDRLGPGGGRATITLGEFVIDFRIFGRKHWRPAQLRAGVDPVRGLYDLRHTYATLALRAGVRCSRSPAKSRLYAHGSSNGTLRTSTCDDSP